MIPSYFEIKNLAIRDEFVTQGNKGLTLSLLACPYGIVYQNFRFYF